MSPTLDRRGLLAAGALALLPLAARAAAHSNAAAAPPVARLEPVTETLFGTTVVDPYRWMENPKDKDWEPYIKGQADYARAVLDSLPGRNSLTERIGELSGTVEIVGSVHVAGPYVFVEKRPPGAASFRLFVRRGLGGKERLLIDPDARRKGDISYAMNYWAESPDGRHVLCGMSPSGSEQAIIEVLETDSGRVLPDRIDRAQYAAPSWLPDSGGFFFNRLAAGGQAGTTSFYKDSVCWLHKLGTNASQDVQVLARGQFTEVPGRDIDFPVVIAQSGSDHVLGAMLSGVQREFALFTNTLAAARRGQGGWKPVCSADDQVVSFAMRGGDLWLLTEKEAPLGRVVHVKASAPAFAKAREVVPQGRAVMRQLYAARDAVYIQQLDGGIGKLSRLARNGSVSAVELPFDGALTFLFGNPRRDGVLAALESWVRPLEVPTD